VRPVPLNATVWHPAGCACIIEYISDDTKPDVFPIYSRHIAVCSIHAALAPGGTRWDAGLPEPVIGYDAGFVGKGRVIRLMIPGLTPAQRGLAQAAVAKFGAGKVIVA
jgi:hypothetical protein